MRPQRDPDFRALVVLLAAGAALAPSDALAYIGPGAGLGMIGSLIAVVAAFLIAVVGFVVFPVRLLLKRRKARSEGAAATGRDGGVSTGR